MDLSCLARLKEGQRIVVKYWDHYANNEESHICPYCGREEVGALEEARGHFAGVVPHKYPLLKLAMHADCSFPFMFILTNCIETVEVQKKNGKQHS